MIIVLLILFSIKNLMDIKIIEIAIACLIPLNEKNKNPRVIEQKIIL
tara:strand:+ start:272 stop:412 length:141 start_codon:yes stop_codon:yes gene_type:complete